MRASELLGRFQDPQEEADGYVARCSHHEDRHQSLRVAFDEDRALLACRAGCATSDVVASAGLRMADLFNVEMDLEAPVARSGGGEVGLADQAQMMAYLTSCSRRLQSEGGPAAEYLLERFGVDLEMASALGLGFDPGHGTEGFHLLGAVHHQVPRVVVPFRDANGIPRGFQARALQDHHVRWSGPTNPPDGGSWSKLAFFSSGSGTDFVVVTEGPGDALTAVAAGLDSVGIRGAALASGVAEALAEALEGRRVVLAADNDRAGAEMNRSLAARLHGLGVDTRILSIPEAFGDLTEWRSGDSLFLHRFQGAVFGAPPFTPDGLDPVDEPEFESVPDSHVAIAKMIVDRFQGRLAYISGLGFHVYERGAWRPDRSERVRLEVFAYGDEVRSEIEHLESLEGMSEAEAERLRNLRRLRVFIERSQEIDRIVKEARTLTTRENEDFDRHPDLLTVRNGIINLRTGELRDHDPSLLLTQIVDVDYNPEAECPRWERFLAEVFPGPEGPEMISFMQRLVGYGISGRTTEQCFAVLWGRGANGKSVFTETLSDVFAGISQTTPFDTFEEKGGGGIPNDVAALRGARLVFAAEGERGKAMAESVVKRLTGQDKITARFMRQEFFSFRPTFLIFLATNHKPHFRSADEGLWRRVKMIPWRRFFEVHERDPYLRDRLVRSESEGILAWAVRGAVSWYAQGLGEPDPVRSATEVYRDSQDPLSSFFPHGPLRPAPGSSVKSSDVWESYLEWCDHEMLPSKERWGRSTFYSGLEERGVIKVRKSSGYVFEGVKLEEQA